jgi:hypothetical protein
MDLIPSRRIACAPVPHVGTTWRSAAIMCAIGLLVSLAGCSGSDSTGCPSVNPQDREGPAPFVSMTDGSFYTVRYKNFGVYVPHVRAPVMAFTDHRRVLHRMGASLQARGVYTTIFTAAGAGHAKITLRGPDGHRYVLQVTVEC